METDSPKPKVIIIAGPTASGKTSLAIRLAKEKNGEVISADSRQVYCGLDLSTGKVTPEETQGIPHHLIDIRHPNTPITAEEWRDLATATIEDILSRGKTPIIAGGTGLYLSLLIHNQTLPQVPPNPTLRANLEQKTTKHLGDLVQQKDPKRFETIDPHNRVRLIRALEIIDALGAVPDKETKPSPYDFELITLLPDRDILRKNIHQRLLDRIDAGMIEEIQQVHDDMHVSWERLEQLGLEMRYISQHLQGQLTQEEMTEKLSTEIWRYAKRQYTWIHHQLL